MFLVNSLFLVRFSVNHFKIPVFFYCLLASVSLLLISSCQDELPSKPEPDNLLNKEEMVDILTDLSLLESNAQLKYVQTTKYAKSLSAAGDSMLKAKGVSPADFEKNMDYYGTHQEVMIEIYRLVNANLVNEKELLEKQMIEERKTKVEAD